METETNGHGQIYGLMANVLSEVENISKGRVNEGQGYRFRGIDDVYAAVHPLFAKHKIFTLPRVLAESTSERTTATGTILRFVNLTMAYDFFAPDGSHVTAEVVGEAMDTGDKASNKAMSAAQKYALIQTLCIPTGSTPDADAVTQPEITGEKRTISKSNTAQENCPKCEGAMWDNRESKRNPKAPDYKCKDKSCDGAVWLKSNTVGNEDVLRDQLFTQAEKVLMLRNYPEEKRKEALGRLVNLSTEEMGKAVERLVSGGNGEQEPAPQRTSKMEQKRAELVDKIRAQFTQELIDKELSEHWLGASLDSFGTDALEQIYADLIPF